MINHPCRKSATSGRLATGLGAAKTIIGCLALGFYRPGHASFGLLVIGRGTMATTSSATAIGETTSDIMATSTTATAMEASAIKVDIGTKTLSTTIDGLITCRICPAHMFSGAVSLLLRPTRG